ncbi:hypothetical protein C7H19_09250 [Aphanothece hegewaldii CCALA 016]|uniref:DUF4278 domain-containing protein n=1 Tax=Aphanothece hegewaldii CCALA 016 TaxID=2107694 RepID=A0A2T1LZ91_9CHRO|nr:hypothetical protein [Aphanothece hegewaldii]PSF37724.1 hypothetical protein C7H19_09250 [Aphanothece hegewaldii CCALA 016]
MELIYRGQTFAYNTRQPLAYEKPCTINWRYRVPNEKYQESYLLKKNYQQPKAINWRWQVPT